MTEVREVPVPLGYTLRCYRDGDEFAIASLYEEAQLGKGSVDAVRVEILGDPCFCPERLFVVEHEGIVVGTASAWVTPEEPEVGYLHMVGVRSDHRGKKLGALLVNKALLYTRAEGFDVQRLLTDDWREPAISLYLNLGYDPLMFDETHPKRWETLATRLNQPSILSRMRWMPPPPRQPLLTRLRRALGFGSVV